MKRMRLVTKQAKKMLALASRIWTLPKLYRFGFEEQICPYLLPKFSISYSFLKQDEDESEDIVENAEKNGNGAKVGGQNNKRGMKRKHDADTKDEPDNKL